jgi:hypothetical protein
MTARESLRRAVEFHRPSWVPIVFQLLAAAWERWGT